MLTGVLSQKSQPDGASSRIIRRRSSRMSLTRGARIGAYEVVGLLGAGGMGGSIPRERHFASGHIAPSQPEVFGEPE